MATLRTAPVPVRSPLPAGLSGSTVVIIGGSSGIGLAAGSLLHGVGARVVLAARDQGRLTVAADRVRAEDGPEVLAVPADGGDEQALARVFDRAGSVDHVLVTAGGLDGAGPVDMLSPETVRSALHGRVWGALAAVRLAAPRLPAGGSITLTSGIYSIRPLPAMAAPIAAIGAVETLTGPLALELAARRLRVNTVRYGSIDTPLMRATAGEAAATAVFLMANNYINGQVITVDGGQGLA